ncbi:hypothetical protein C2E31_08775 [Rhodopirellula baltica]|nr:hypothetical protein C2E31_27965 [Rhodopirellula baltica]PNY37244.1 hypothetical protein C2E31_08775 [Rhodopirellula baltica]
MICGAKLGMSLCIMGNAIPSPIRRQPGGVTTEVAVNLERRAGVDHFFRLTNKAKRLSTRLHNKPGKAAKIRYRFSTAEKT